MSINEDREDLMPQITAEEGTVAHQQQVAAVSQWDKRQWEKRQAAVTQPRFQEGDQYASYQVDLGGQRGWQPDRTSKGSMAHGEGFTPHDGLVQVGPYRTDPANAEQMRLSMRADEWTSLTGLPHNVSLLNAPTTGQAQQTELQRMQADHQAKVDAEREASEQRVEDEGEAALREEEQFREEQTSPIETAIEQHFGEGTVSRARVEVIENGELSTETAARLQVDPSTFDLITQHHIARAETVLDPLNSSTNMMELGLSEAEQRTARKMFVAGDLQGFRQLGERARDRLANVGVKDLQEMLTPKQIEVLQVRDRGHLGPTITIKGIGEIGWGYAVREGYIRF